MRFVVHFAALTPLLIFLSGISAHSAVLGSTDSLTIQQAIEKAIEKNLDYQTAKNNLENSKINYDLAWNKMFLPTVNLELTRSLNSTFGQVSGSDVTASPTGRESFDQGYPGTELALRVGQYRLFNFWKDALDFEKAQLQLKIDQRRLADQKRLLRISVAKAYFAAKNAQANREIAAKFLKMAELILDYFSSRRKIGEGTDLDIDSAQISYTDAYKELGNRVKEENRTMTDLAIILGDGLGFQRKLVSELKYIPIVVTLAQALDLFAKNSQPLLETQIGLQISKLDYDLVDRNRLPLPTVAFDGVKFAYNDTYARTYSANSTNSSPSGNLNITASISFTLPLCCDAGWFGNAAVKRSALQVNNAELNAAKAKLFGESQIQAAMVSIDNEEKNQKEALKSYEASAQLLDGIIKRMMSDKQTSRLEMRDTLNSARNAEFFLRESIFQHFLQKCSLLELVGVEKLPGDSYEWQK